MSNTLSRIVLIFGVSLCVAISVCSSMLNMSHLVGMSDYAEIANPDTTDADRAEIAAGVARLTSVQVQFDKAIFWLSLIAALVILSTVFWGFQSKPES